uniref:Uncharacterized protein n=1 Tax=Anguilla anguilla TaxID=7936 RepID=A0A0E9V964_ANGAN
MNLIISSQLTVLNCCGHLVYYVGRMLPDPLQGKVHMCSWS